MRRVTYDGQVSVPQNTVARRFCTSRLKQIVPNGYFRDIREHGLDRVDLHEPRHLPFAASYANRAATWLRNHRCLY